jgi:hypothetical protein
VLQRLKLASGGPSGLRPNRAKRVAARLRESARYDILLPEKEIAPTISGYDTVDLQKARGRSAPGALALTRGLQPGWGFCG